MKKLLSMLFVCILICPALIPTAYAEPTPERKTIYLNVGDRYTIETGRTIGSDDFLNANWYSQTGMSYDDYSPEASSGIDVFTGSCCLYLIIFVILMIVYIYHVMKENYTGIYFVDIIMAVMFTLYPVFLFGMNSVNIKLVLSNFTVFYAYGYYLAILLLVINVIAAICFKRMKTKK